MGRYGGMRIGVWGLAFKAGTDDLRSSLALRILADLDERGATAVAYDPPSSGPSCRAAPCSRVRRWMPHAPTRCSCLTEWPEFCEVDADVLAASLRRRLVVDGRNLLDGEELARCGIRYRGVGLRRRPTPMKRRRRRADADEHANFLKWVSPLPLPIRRRRVASRGKFLFAGDAKFYVRGTTYGTFALDPRAANGSIRRRSRRDFAFMSATASTPCERIPFRRAGCSTRHRARAARHGRDPVGAARRVPRRRRRRSERSSAACGEYASECAGHPAILCYAVGNEIPGPVVRWLGPRRVERFVERLYRAVKTEDAGASRHVRELSHDRILAASLPRPRRVQRLSRDSAGFEAYLARLQHIAGDRPLVMAEVGLDSRRHGEKAQASRSTGSCAAIFESGCAGAFAFAWTDEWHRGGYAIEDWDFGLTRRDRTPKPALAAVREAFSAVPYRSGRRWPRVSVVVCAFNAQDTIARMSRRSARRRIPELRGDRRQRRLDRRYRHDRRALSGARSSPRRTAA